MRSFISAGITKQIPPANLMGRASSGVLGRAASGFRRRSSKEILDSVNTEWVVASALEERAGAEAQAHWYLAAPSRGTTGIRAQRNKNLLLSHQYGKRAALEKQMVDSGEMVRIDEHPFLEMMRVGSRGAPWLSLSGIEVDILTVKTRLLVGEELKILARDKNGVPVRWFPIPPHWMRAPTPDRPKWSWAVGKQGEENPEDIFYSKIPRPADPFFIRGGGLGEAGDHEIAIDSEMAAYLYHVMKNRSRPDLLVVAQGMGDEEATDFQERWLSANQGSHNASLIHFIRPPNIPGVDVKIQELGKSPADLGAAVLRTYQRDSTGMLFGVPPMLLGVTGGGNRSQIVGQLEMYRGRIVRTLDRRRRNLQDRFFQPQTSGVSEYDPRFVLMYELPPIEDTEARLQAVTRNPWMFDQKTHHTIVGLPSPLGAEGRFYVPKRGRFVRDLDNMPED